MWSAVKDFTFVAFLLFSAYSCNRFSRQPFSGVELLGVTTLAYPSGSTLASYNGNIYLTGDDATQVLVLDRNIKTLDKISYLPAAGQKISKALKADIEASEIVDSKLWLFGSGSLSPMRDFAYAYHLQNRKLERVSLTGFYKNVRNLGISDLNIEGAALINNDLLLANRGNTSKRENLLILTPFKRFPDAAMKRLSIQLPAGAGLSGLSYLPEKDALLITASTEATQSAYSDGKIGTSYLGIVYEASKKLSAHSLTVKTWVALPDVDRRFRGQKIESLCLLPEKGRNSTLLLVADNDDGKSVLFQLGLEL